MLFMICFTLQIRERKEKTSNKVNGIFPEQDINFVEVEVSEYQKKSTVITANPIKKETENEEIKRKANLGKKGKEKSYKTNQRNKNQEKKKPKTSTG